MQIAQNLQKIMTLKHVSKYRLAKLLNVHQTTIKNWIDGKTVPSPEKVSRIAAALNVYESELLDGYSTTAHNIRAYREKSNLTQNELAEKLNKPLSLIVEYESGHIKPSLDEIKEMSEVFGVPYVKMIYEPLVIAYEVDETTTSKLEPSDIVKLTDLNVEQLERELNSISDEELQKLYEAVSISYYKRKIEKEKK